MVLDPTTTQTVLDWVKNHCPGLRCSACGNQQRWSALDMVAMPCVATPYAGGAIPMSPTTGAITFVPLSCDNCGVTLFFPAKMIGVAP
jgi:hypothetical protein